MRISLAIILFLWIVLGLGITSSADAGTEYVSKVIEGFIGKQFPDADSHFWIVNGAQWQEENELVVDVNAVAFMAAGGIPTENRYLILIVSGKLAGAQRIPLDGAANCQPEQS